MPCVVSTARSGPLPRSPMPTSFKECRSDLRCLALSPDGKTLAVGGNGWVKWWDPATGAERFKTPDEPYMHTVSAVAFSPDGKLLAKAGASCVTLWNAVTG